MTLWWKFNRRVMGLLGPKMRLNQAVYKNTCLCGPEPLANVA